MGNESSAIDTAPFQARSISHDSNEIDLYGKLYNDQHLASAIKTRKYNLNNIRVAHFDKNLLKYLPKEVLLLENLSQIGLSGNLFESVPEELMGLTKLKELRIYGCQITNVPPSISKLQSLTNLNLSRNLLTTLPKEICCLTDLKKLCLDGNKLVKLPVDITALEKLSALYLDSNQKIPSFLITPGYDIQWRLKKISRHFLVEEVRSSVLCLIWIRFKNNEKCVLESLPKELVKMIAQFLFATRLEPGVWG